MGGENFGSFAQMQEYKNERKVDCSPLRRLPAPLQHTEHEDEETDEGCQVPGDLLSIQRINPPAQPHQRRSPEFTELAHSSFSAHLESRASVPSPYVHIRYEKPNATMDRCLLEDNDDRGELADSGAHRERVTSLTPPGTGNKKTPAIPPLLFSLTLLYLLRPEWTGCIKGLE